MTLLCREEMTAMPNKYYSGNCKTTVEEGVERMCGKQILIKKCGQQVLSSAGGREGGSKCWIERRGLLVTFHWDHQA